MRTIIFLFSGLFLFSTPLQAQQSKYEKAMASAVDNIRAAQDAESFLAAANVFERIAKAEAEEWLPLYYQSYAHMMTAIHYFGQQKMNDCLAHVKKAEEKIELAKKIAPKESEIFALHAFILQGYIWEDPQSKGAQYTPMVMQAAETAIALNSENPRGFYIKGQQLFHMPTFFGGGPEAAMPFLKKALEKYEDFKPVSSLYPNWGKANVEQLIGQVGNGN